MTAVRPPSKFLPAFSGKIGIARRDITPPVGIYARNWGAAKADVSQGTHRPLLLSVVIFGDILEKIDPLVLVAMDLGWWRSAEEEILFTEAAVQAAGGDASRVIITLSHTHAGPSISWNDEKKPGGEHLRPWLEKTKEAMVSAIYEAMDSAQPAILESGTGWCDLAKNRDLRDPEKNRWIVGWNPEVKADPTLLVGRISKPDGTLLGTLVNYACHPTTLAWENELISPDFVGAMREIVEHDTDCPCVFIQGASGELAPAHQYVGDVGVADRHGKHLGYSVLATLSGMLPMGEALYFEEARESGAALGIWRLKPREEISKNIEARILTVSLPIREDLPTSDDIQRAIEVCTDRVILERHHRKLLIRKSLGEGREYPVEHRIWQIGDMIIISVPNEPYSSLQIALREAAPEKAVFVATLANGRGATSYLAPQDFYDREIYTVWQTPFAAGSLERLTKELVAAI